ncbi:Glycosyl transferase family 8 [Musa troglodytarum]|uniref:Glycosyl transferase family 8 n=1 Tax=Musa troglodytarum TaxID=320322 RepID=A0A9E7L042_9LILI|nr:Glycosyl transferase family 8 [Musa troglodytarum]
MAARCVNRVIYLDSDLVVVDDIGKLWRAGLGSRASGGAGYTGWIERWMEVQKSGASPSGAGRIYELGSLQPFLLVFAGHVTPIERR